MIFAIGLDSVKSDSLKTNKDALKYSCYLRTIEELNREALETLIFKSILCVRPCWSMRAEAEAIIDSYPHDIDSTTAA